MRINLLPKEERPLKQSEVRWEFLVGLVGILLLGSVVLFSWIETGKLQELKSSYQEAHNREILLNKQAQQVQELRSRLSSLELIEAEYQDLFAEYDGALKALPHLTNHSFPRIWIEGVIWEGETVELLGYTQDMTSLSQYLNYLNEHCEQALLQTLLPQEGSGFYVFTLEIKGVGGDDSAEPA